MGQYNKELCDERHTQLKEEYGIMWKKIEDFKIKIDRIYLLLTSNLVGVVFALILLLVKK